VNIGVRSRILKRQCENGTGDRLRGDAVLAFGAGCCEKTGMPVAHSFRTLLHGWLPPAFVKIVRKIRRRRAFFGDFRTWGEALAASKGYADQTILAKVVSATREAAAGRGRWDRDGAVFDTMEVNAPLLAALRRIAEIEKGQLDLVDFGGALGSTWRQHREALRDLGRIRWRVVEQPHYVEAGQEFADAVLAFYGSLNEALAEGSVSTVLFSSVLPYVELPHALLAEVAGRGVRHVIIDRTSFAADGRERIVVQRVPSELGGGSYPCRLFARDALLAPLASHYRLVGEWPGFDDVDPCAVFRGFCFEHIP
jgi:putative methyltransferase (TIGR04325 family)